MEQIDFLAIGDITTDAFIRLKEAKINCDAKHEHCQICLSFGDKVPYESVTVVPAVGNSPNAAVAAARLGLHSALLTDLGDDEEGNRAIKALEQNGVQTHLIKKHSSLKTNYHYVLWYEDERTILIKHEVYPYVLPELAPPRWIYLSSIGETSMNYHQQIIRYLNEHPEVKLAFQPGTFQLKAGLQELAGLYKRTEIFFCNVEEAKRLLNNNNAEVKSLLTQIAEYGPKIVVITDGPRGAYALADGQHWFMPPYPDPAPPLQRTGAGDALASTVTSALAMGKPMSEALRWGPINSMSVVQKIGAQAGLLTRPELEELLNSAPADYKVQKI
ncbi:MAG: carbohydrate kinase family protein [Patescibacteria group bacterium]